MTQVRLIELVLVARRDFAGRAEHWAAFEELVARSGVGRFVFPALDLADRLVPGTMNASVLERLAASVPSRVRRIVRSTQPASAQRLHPLPGLRERLVWVASLREALAALAWLAWPYDGDGPASPREAIGAQWRRIRRAVRRIVQAQMSR